MSIKCLCDQSVGYTCESCEFERLEDSIKKLKAENEKLKKCVEFYSEVFNWRDSGQYYGHGTIKTDDKEDLSDDDRVRLFGGKRARQVLKELEE